MMTEPYIYALPCSGPSLTLAVRSWDGLYGELRLWRHVSKEVLVGWLFSRREAETNESNQNLQSAMMGRQRGLSLGVAVGSLVVGLAAGTSWMASNTYSGTGSCSGNNLVASTITVGYVQSLPQNTRSVFGDFDHSLTHSPSLTDARNNPMSVASECSMGTNQSGCIAVNTFTQSCNIPDTGDQTAYAFEVSEHLSSRASLHPQSLSPPPPHVYGRALCPATPPVHHTHTLSLYSSCIA
jgi:hypothetical protein